MDPDRLSAAQAKEHFVPTARARPPARLGRQSQLSGRVKINKLMAGVAGALSTPVPRIPIPTIQNAPAVSRTADLVSVGVK